MENTVRLAKSEIRNWLEIRGYHCKDIYVIDNVIVECRPKIFSKDLNEFEIEFNHKPSLDGVFFDESGEKNYKYYFNHDNLVKLYSKINAFFLMKMKSLFSYSLLELNFLFILMKNYLMFKSKN